MSTRLESGEANAGGVRLRVPRLMLAAAVVHMMVGVIAAYAHWSGIVSDGLWRIGRWFLPRGRSRSLGNVLDRVDLDTAFT